MYVETGVVNFSLYPTVRHCVVTRTVGPTAPLVTELLQLTPALGYGTVYRHISEMADLGYRTVA